MFRRLLLSLLPLCVLIGCKTNEANYRAAYEAARTKANADAAADDGLDENTRRMLARSRERATAVHIVGSDTLRVTTLFVKMTQGDYDRVPKFSVVVNAFSQVFNAKALCSRLKENGFPGAYIFENSTPDYYVAAAGSNSIDSVPEILRRVEAAGNPGSRAGFPAIIRSGGWSPK